jgi:Protein kinase domain
VATDLFCSSGSVLKPRTHLGNSKSPRESLSTKTTGPCFKMAARDLDKMMSRLSVNENVNPYTTTTAKPVTKVVVSILAIQITI